MPKSRPRARVEGYRGPYHHRMLEEARNELLHIIDSKDTVIWNRIRQKTGIHRNGERDSSVDGYGVASTRFSHADLIQEDAADMDVHQAATMTDSRTEVDTAQSTLSSSASRAPQDISIQRTFSNDTSHVELAVTVNTSSGHSPDQGLVKIEKKDKSKQESVNNREREQKTEEKKKDKSTSESSVESPDMIIVEDTSSEPIIIDVSVDSTSQDLSADDDVEFIKEEQASVDGPSTSSRDQNIRYKCDFCKVITNTTKDMKKHLMQVLHYSASSYTCSAEGKLLTLVKRLVIIYESALYKNVLAICPIDMCRRIFKTIHECSLHFSQKHGHPSPTRYGLARVLKEEIKIVPTDKVLCLDCDELFEKADYTKHQKNHDKPKNNCYYFCHSCETFKKRYVTAFTHKSELHVDEGREGLRKLSIVQVSPVDTHNLPGVHVANNITGQPTNTKVIHNDKMITVSKTQNTSPSKPKAFPDIIVIGDSENSEDIIEISDGNSSLNCSVSLPDDYDKEQNSNEDNVIIKCDLCETKAASVEEMQKHLQEVMHYSASSFWLDTEGKLTHLKQRLVITNKHALYKTVLAVCPYRPCGSVFRTIHECGLHFQIQHDVNAPPTYGLVNILNEEDNHISLANKQKYLHSKNIIEDHIDEDLEVEELNSSYGKYFFCHSCQSFSKSDYTAATHISAQHFNEDGVRKLTILRVGQVRVLSLHDGTQARDQSGRAAGGQVSPMLWESAEIDSDYGKMYKCDYCDYVAERKDTATQHLHDVKHHSASLLLVDKNDQTPKYLFEPMAIKSCLTNRSTVAICPDPKCFHTFHSIYACHEHVNHFHQSVSDREYALAEVKIQETIEFDTQRKCFINKPGMDQYTGKKKCKEYRGFLCCSVMFSDPLAIKSHIQHMHCNKKKSRKAKRKPEPPGRDFVTVQFFLLEQSKVKHTLLPFLSNPHGLKASSRNTLNSLQQLRKLHRSKMLRRSIRKKIKEVRHILRN